MVVHYLYVMILITGLFQSINFIDGLRCYQCDHPGTVTTSASCSSRECKISNLNRRFARALGNLSMKGVVNVKHLEIEQLCYLQIRRPIPFNGHTRGCHFNLRFKNVSMELGFLDSPTYEDWYVCYKDDCNDWDIMSRTGKLKKVYTDDPDKMDDMMSNAHTLSRMRVVTLLVINFICFHYYLNT